jgi:glycosyltransferase involved in cell wall biosynthesis
VINPRGFRAYVCNEAFFQAIPLVLKELPTARFICPAMAGEAQAQRWIEALGIGEAVELLPQQTRLQMAGLFRRSQVAVSPSTHDGTPNTLLEAMACGCTPVVGDIESLREWIISGENGLLVDPRDPVALAEAMLHVLRDPALRQRAREHNTRLVSEKAEYRWVMREAEEFYLRLVAQ